MKNRPRTELKARFKEGSLPSMSDFNMLIDSTMNINDDGIEHSPSRGLCLTQVTGDEHRLLSFYRQGITSAWAIGLDQSARSLAFEVARPKTGDGARSPDQTSDAVLTLVAPDYPKAFAEGAQASVPIPARVGVNRASPAYELDVGGTVASSARRGAEGLVAFADSKWHTIKDDMQGCVALEVVAGTGKEGTGKYALMHAFALKVFDAKGEITYHRTHYGARRHRLELRWLQETGSATFKLQIKVNCHYGAGVRIRCHITSLWDDHTMASCSDPVSGEGANHG
jgi:hypothetical protein